MLLAGCTSAEPDAAAPSPTTAEPSGEVPPSTGQSSLSPSTSLPDPALLPQELSLAVQQASTVVNSAGTGDEVITLAGVSNQAHVVLRLVCAGPGDSRVLDASGRMLIGGSCDGLDGSSIDLLDVEWERFGHVTVQTTPATQWRLYIGTY